jgi:N-acetylmuramoyl-L-alanine amidase
MKKYYFPLLLLLALSAHTMQAASRLHIASNTFQIKSDIELQEKWNQHFLSLPSFAKTMGFNLFEENDKHKIVIKTSTAHFIFTGENSFVIVNKSKVIQMQVECLWYENQVWISVNELVNLINAYSSLQSAYDDINKILTINPLDVNIQGIEISAKKNGTMIRIHTSEKFTKENIDIGKRYSWYHIEIKGARFDSLQIINTPVNGIIRKIQTRRFEDIAFFEFKLRGNLVSDELIIDEFTNNIDINLRTDAAVEVNKNVLKDLEEQKKRSVIDVIVLDAGHGGKDPGTVGYNGKIIEKKIVLSITLELGKLIEKNMHGVKVIYTRKDDTFIPLRRRTQIANENSGKLFISIHANYVGKKSIRGFETWFMGLEKNLDERAREVVLKENSVVEEFEGKHAMKEYEDMPIILATMMQSANIKQSQYLASLVQNSMKINLKKMDIESNGIKQGLFYVMWSATMPNILVEVGYTSNKKEANLLLKESVQKEISKAIFKGIVKYKEDVEGAI